MNTLIVYGTRYGATAGTSEEIAKVLQGEGFDVKVVNAKEEKIKDNHHLTSLLLVAECKWANGPANRKIF
jgi:menaquinone-dependent protoporphyrinogen IX oxidase